AGGGSNLSFYRPDPRWSPPLAEAVLALARDPRRIEIAGIAMTSRFRDTDEAARIRRTVADRLTDDAGQLSPVIMEAYLFWLRYGKTALPTDFWPKLLTALKQRRAAEREPEARRRLGRLVVQAADLVGPAAWLDALREELRAALPDRKPEAASELFAALLR